MNRSDWKGCEKLVATALGGVRRFRTMGDYGKTVDDVRFPKEFRKKYPKVKTVAVEVKKRKSLNIHALFSEAKEKYAGDTNKHIILASKVPRKGSFKKKKEAIIKDAEQRCSKAYWVAVGKLDVTTKKKEDEIRKRLNTKMKSSIEVRIKRLKARSDISTLVTIELDFFKELWNLWIGREEKDE